MVLAVMVGQVGSVVVWKTIAVEWTHHSHNKLVIQGKFAELREMNGRIRCTGLFAVSGEVVGWPTVRRAERRAKT